jgi:hypothetical protein
MDAKPQSYGTALSCIADRLRDRVSETHTKLGTGLAKLVVALRPSNWRTEAEATDMVAAMAAMVTVMAEEEEEEEEAGGMQRRQGRGARGMLL